MKYTVNFEQLKNSFSFPRAAVDNYLKLASAAEIKTLLAALSELSGELDVAVLSEKTGLKSDEVSDALAFWAQCELLLCDDTKPENPVAAPVIKDVLPTREDIIRRGLEDKNVSLMLREAQMKFGRNLKQNESQVLVSLYDDNGMNVSVILMLLQYALDTNRCNLSFLRSTAAYWIKQGVVTIADAEKMIADSTKKMLCWKTLERVFGIEYRKPSEKELAAASLWIDEWKMGEDVLKCAYDVCVDKKSKFNFAYVSAIIEAWHKNGIDTKEKAQAESQKPTKKTDDTSFDTELFNKYLMEN